MKEQWKQVPGSDGWYEVSNLGNVRSYAYRGPKTDKRRAVPVVLRTYQSGFRGYAHLDLKMLGRSRYVHDLVAEAFVGKRPSNMQVDHIDGDKANNLASNLRYITKSKNLTGRECARKLDHKSAAKIFHDSRSYSEIAKRWGCSMAMVYLIKSGKAWKGAGQVAA